MEAAANIGSFSSPSDELAGNNGRAAVYCLELAYCVVELEPGRSRAMPGENLRHHTAIVLQPGWYGSVRSGMGGATAAEYSPSVSQVSSRSDTH